MEDKNEILPASVGVKVDDSPDAKALAEAQKPDPLHDYGDDAKVPAELPPHVVDPAPAPVSETIKTVEE